MTALHLPFDLTSLTGMMQSILLVIAPVTTS